MTTGYETVAESIDKLADSIDTAGEKIAVSIAGLAITISGLIESRAPRRPVSIAEDPDWPRRTPGRHNI